MPRTHDIGRFYFHGLRYPVTGAPVLERAVTAEVEPPYREGRGWAVKLAPRTVLIVGWWFDTGRDEEEALTAALGALGLAVAPAELGQWPGGSNGPQVASE